MLFDGQKGNGEWGKRSDESGGQRKQDLCARKTKWAASKTLSWTALPLTTTTVHFPTHELSPRSGGFLGNSYSYNGQERTGSKPMANKKCGVPRHRFLMEIDVKDGRKKDTRLRRKQRRLSCGSAGRDVEMPKLDANARSKAGRGEGKMSL